MSNTTLVLNADANPISIVPLSTIHWQDAVRILVLGRASAIENYDKWVIRSPTVQLRMPSVIMLKEFQRHNGKIEFSRYNVILRDSYTCQYCGEKFDFNELTFDHVIPRKDGGKTNWENIVSACYRCNQEKAHHHHMKPIMKPYRPNYWQLANNRKKFPITVSSSAWVQYLNWDSDVKVDGSKSIDNFDSQVDLPFLFENN